MRILGSAGLGVASLLVVGCAPVPGPVAAGPHPDYGPASTGPIAPASPYAPNGSTGYAPYSQDSYDTVVHDGSNGSAGGRR